MFQVFIPVSCLICRLLTLGDLRATDTIARSSFADVLRWRPESLFLDVLLDFAMSYMVVLPSCIPSFRISSRIWTNKNMFNWVRWQYLLETVPFREYNRCHRPTCQSSFATARGYNGVPSQITENAHITSNFLSPLTFHNNASRDKRRPLHGFSFVRFFCGHYCIFHIKNNKDLIYP